MAKKNRSRWKSLVRIVLAIALGLLMLRIFGCMERLAFFPSREPFQTPVGYEDVFFETPDGLTLHGWFMPAEPGPDGAPPPVVLHCHGNAGNVAGHGYFSDFLPRHGVSVFLFDYRGYGRSERGSLRKKRLLIDTEAALDYLLTRDDVDPDRIGVYGVSLGGAFALPLAAQRDEVRSVVTLSTFSTWRGAAADMAPVLGRLLIPGGLDPIDSVAGLTGKPWLIVHGTSDSIINDRHARLLHEEAERRGIDVVMRTSVGGSHNSLFDQDPGARDAIAEFFIRSLQ